jgi:aspartyl-tRNA(Asn)/glutamyl-tRNA(Gln) amidotransferase subunit B
MDTGKSLHEADAAHTLIDLNRAGCALMEVVTEPDMRSAEEAVAFVRAFQQLLRHLGTSDGNMEVRSQPWRSPC